MKCREIIFFNSLATKLIIKELTNTISRTNTKRQKQMRWSIVLFIVHKPLWFEFFRLGIIVRIHVGTNNVYSYNIADVNQYISSWESVFFDTYPVYSGNGWINAQCF